MTGVDEDCYVCGMEATVFIFIRLIQQTAEEFGIGDRGFRPTPALTTVTLPGAFRGFFGE